MDYIFITGASGLLGSEIVRQLSEMNFRIIGQYYKNKPALLKNTTWLYGDFSNLSSLKNFLNTNKKELKKSSYLINCYGPITYKNIKNLKTEDYQNDYFSNVIVPIEIINFFLNQEKQYFKSVVNIGFELAGTFKPVKNVLPYLMAKNALLEYTLSLEEVYMNIKFNMVSPITLEGAKVPSRNGTSISVQIIAKAVIKVLLGKKSGENRIYK